MKINKDRVMSIISIILPIGLSMYSNETQNWFFKTIGLIFVLIVVIYWLNFLIKNIGKTLEELRSKISLFKLLKFIMYLVLVIIYIYFLFVFLRMIIWDIISAFSG